jgi:hypothetical protein
MSFWAQKKKTTRTHTSLEKNSKENCMKIILSLLLLFSLSMVFSATTLTVEEKFNKAYEDSLKNRWEKPQE